MHGYQSRHQRIRAHRAHGVSRSRAAFRRHRDRRHQRPARARLSRLHAEVRLGAWPLQGRHRRRRQHAGRERQEDPPDRGQGSRRTEVGRSRRRHRRRVDGPVPDEGHRAEAHRAGAKKVIMSAPSKDDTPMFVFGVNHKSYAGQADHLERLVHDELPRADRKSVARHLGHQARPDDDRARDDRDAEDRRRPVEQGLARRPRHSREHHPVVHGRGEGRRQGDSRTQQEADRHVVPRADVGRLGRRPDGRAAARKRPTSRSAPP